MNKIGQYEILEELGRGGMGRVYKARLLLIEEIVALKLFDPLTTVPTEVDDLKKRFVREAGMLWKINHPHIVTIRHVDQIDGTPFYVMEHLPRTLADALGSGDGTRVRKNLDEQSILRLIKQILEALAFLHKNNIVHRDIKPSNILLTEDGDAKLSDFGIAKSLNATGYTTTGLSIGDRDYAAPEQSDAKRADHRCDIYSLGLTLYMMLTGKHPFSTRFKPVVSLRKGLSLDWDKIIDQATEEDPGDRFQSAEQMQIVLHRLANRRYRSKTKEAKKEKKSNDLQDRIESDFDRAGKMMKEAGLGLLKILNNDSSHISLIKGTKPGIIGDIHDDDMEKLERIVGRLKHNGVGACCLDGDIDDDVNSQSLVLRDQFGALDEVHDKFVNLLNVTLTSTLMISIEVKQVSKKIAKFEEFLKAFSNPTGFSIYTMEPLIGSAMMALEPNLCFAMIDVMFGGVGKPLAKVRKFTQIEQHMLQRIYSHMLQVLEQAWSVTYNIKVVQKKTETKPECVSLVSNGDLALIFVFSINSQEFSGIFYICTPYLMLEPIKDKLALRYLMEKNRAHAFRR